MYHKIYRYTVQYYSYIIVFNHVSCFTLLRFWVVINSGFSRDIVLLLWENGFIFEQFCTYLYVLFPLAWHCHWLWDVFTIWRSTCAVWWATLVFGADNDETCLRVSFPTSALAKKIVVYYETELGLSWFDAPRKGLEGQQMILFKFVCTLQVSGVLFTILGTVSYSRLFLM